MSDTMKVANGTLLAAQESLGALSRLGANQSDIRKRVARLIMAVNKALEEYFLEREQIMSLWADRDDDTGEIKTKSTPDGQQNAVMRNPVEAQMALNDLSRKEVELRSEVPLEPFTWEELEAHFLTTGTRKPAVTPAVAAGLGPFIKPF